MNNCVIKEAVETEYEQLTNVIRESFLTVAAEFGYTESTLPSNGAFLTVDRLYQKKLEGGLLYGLYDGSNAVGYFELESKGDIAYELGKLAVLPEYRHNGYGAAIVSFAAEKAKSLGAEWLYVGLLNINTVLKDWYIRMGFKEVAVNTLPGHTLAFCFMEKYLC